MGLSPDFESLGGWPGVLGRLLKGESLTASEAECTLDAVLSESATEIGLAAMLALLRVKVETVDEMVGFVRSMWRHAEPMSIDVDVVDLVGTGGDRLRSINVTTLAALIAAGAGVKVCKHGNRAQSSSVGTADVLEALGVRVDLGPVGVVTCVKEAGMGFCFAPRFHPAMRVIGPVRKAIGIPTVFNFLGPLMNPAHARRQLVGVSDPSMAATMAGVLGANGSVRSMVVFADDGLDEFSTTSPTTVIDVVGLADGVVEIVESRFDALDVGIPRASIEDLYGGDAAFNARAIRRVLSGDERGAHRDIGILNAAAGMVVAGQAISISEGIEWANASIDSGRAEGVLDALVEVSNREGVDS